MNKLWWVIIGLAAVIVLMILFDRDPEPVSTQKWKDEINKLESEKATIKLGQTQIIQKSKDRAEADSLVIVTQEREIQHLYNKAAKARTPRVDTLIMDNPDLKSFVETQQEIIQEFKVQVDTLKAAVEFREQLFNDLVRSEQAEDSVNNQIRAVDLAQIAALTKEVKKEKKGKKFWRTMSFIFGGAGAYAGSKI